MAVIMRVPASLQDRAYFGLILNPTRMVFEQIAKDAKAADERREYQAACPQPLKGLLQCLPPVSQFHQVIEWAHQQHRIESPPGYRAEVACVSYHQLHLLIQPCLCHPLPALPAFHGRKIDCSDLIAPTGQLQRIPAGRRADFQDSNIARAGTCPGSTRSAHTQADAFPNGNIHYLNNYCNMPQYH